MYFNLSEKHCFYESQNIYLQYGAVFKGLDTATNSSIAVKVFKTTLFGTLTQDFGRERAKQLSEAKMIKKVDHPNVIRLLHLIENEDEICLVFPLMMHSPEDEIYNDSYKYAQQRTKQMISMVLAGVKHIHERHIIHRDLKPGNIFDT